ncbi:MAG: anhydro-N-acetylmuramic acid kinase [Rhodocyclaceae bacterium]
MSEARYFIGLMSGTSLDGVDAVLADFDDGPHLLATHHVPYEASLREPLLALNTPRHDELRSASELSVRVSACYAQACNALIAQAGLDKHAVRAIGCHGQTVRHRPDMGYTLQLNQPALIAERCGIDVIADFRSRDIAAGGQGAPLVPAFHAQVLATADEHRVVLNLGGIANVTDLPTSGKVRGFDTGPANALMDGWIEQHLAKTFDADGAWAASGRVLPDLLARFLAHPFLHQAPPKSCGREEFSAEWLASQLHGDEAPQDVQATLAELTARACADAVRQHCGQPDRLIVCGGGARNGHLMRRLAALLAPTTVTSSDAHGVPSQWMEAFAFAWLARQCVLRQPGNLSAVTGARGPRILGALYPA